MKGSRNGRRRGLIRPRRPLREEFEFHLEMTVRELVARGMDPAAARREARRRFGRRLRHEAACVEIERRRRESARRGGIMHDLGHDLRFALRVLRRSPGFTAVAVLTLALAIGANAAAFTVVDSVVLRPLPYADPDELATLWVARGDGGADGLSYPDWIDVREQVPAFEDVGFWVHWSYDVSVDGRPASIESARVSPAMFGILGVAPALGRDFRPDEGGPGADHVVILGHGTWRTRYGGDESIVGGEIRLDGEPYTVIGVMPEGFRFPYEGAFGQGYWTPMTLDPAEESRRSRWLNPVGRLADGATLDGAREQLDALSGRLAEAFPEASAGLRFEAKGLHDAVVGEEPRQALWVLHAVVGFVLLIACANLANLLLARVERRQREIAVRAALGAGRFRLLRQLLTEGLILALAGGLLGLGLAAWSLDALVALIPTDIPRLDEVSLDGTVVLFSLGLSLVTGAVFGLLPARQAARADLQDTLKAAGSRASGPGRQRFRAGLVVVEIAIALVLLVGAGLLLRSFVRLAEEDPGFDPDRVLMFQVSPGGSAEQRLAFYEELLTRLQALPDVEAAGANSAPPLSGVDWTTAFVPMDRPAPDPGEAPSAQLNFVTPGYFETLRIPVVQGRSFDPGDRPGRPGVVMVNEALARRVWPDAGAVGRTLAFPGEDGPGPALEVVGVVADVRKLGIDREPPPEVYVPVLQRPGFFLNYVVRARGEPLALADAVRAVVWDLSADVALQDMTTLPVALDGQVARPRFNLQLLGVFAALALLLATLGIYGVISYATTERTREIGVRMALGARSNDVLGLLLRQGLVLAAAGLALGLAAALWMTRLLTGLLYETPATDPLTYVAVSVVLGAVALLATWVPARRATRIDPVVALRE